jgi:rare lipoprotein A
MESQEKNEPRGRGARGHRAVLKRPSIDKTMSSRIVLVLRRCIIVGRARIALRCLPCAIVLMLLAAGCARRSAARLPSPPARIGSTETGLASWYGVPYDGRPTASGEIFDMEKLTAAHRALPFETWVEITNLSNGKQVDVRITDRGPFVRGRIIDLSMAAARQIDMVRAGIARVRLKVIDPPETATPVSASAVTVNLPPMKDAPVNALDRTQTGAGEYAVQAGVFFDPSRAEALRETLPYPDARVVEPHGERPGDPPLWRVLVGHALTAQAATALATEVEKSAGVAIVVKEDATQIR